MLRHSGGVLISLRRARASVGVGKRVLLREVSLVRVCFRGVSFVMCICATVTGVGIPDYAHVVTSSHSSCTVHAYK